MSEFRTTGIVVKRTNYAEADRILRVFTRDFGMISVIAKGIRRPRSRQAGTLELFCIAELRLHRRTGELFLLTGSSPAADSNHAITALPQLAVFYSVSEWLLALLPAEKAVPEIFELLSELLLRLPRESKLDLLELATKTKLLQILGFLPADFIDPRIQKLIRFLVAANFSDIACLAADKSAFISAGDELEKIFCQLTDKASRVPDATADWD